MRKKDGSTALMEAISFEQEEVAKYLLESGADIDVEDNKGDTALVYAVRHKMYEIAFLLLKLDIDTEPKFLKKALILVHFKKHHSVKDTSKDHEYDGFYEMVDEDVDVKNAVRQKMIKDGDFWTCKDLSLIHI